MGKQFAVRVVSYRLRGNFYALQYISHFFNVSNGLITHSGSNRAGTIFVITDIFYFFAHDKNFPGFFVGKALVDAVFFTQGTESFLRT